MIEFRACEQFYWKCYLAMTPPVRLMVSWWSDGHDFQNGREVTPSSERLLQKCIVSRILMLLKTCTYECTFVHTCCWKCKKSCGMNYPKIIWIFPQKINAQFLRIEIRNNFPFYSYIFKWFRSQSLLNSLFKDFFCFRQRCQGSKSLRTLLFSQDIELKFCMKIGSFSIHVNKLLLVINYIRLFKIFGHLW